MKHQTSSLIKSALALSLLSMSTPTYADNYIIDTQGMHAFIQFRVQHLGYSWLYGRFNDFSGTFYFDESAQQQSNVQLNIMTSSIDTNHAERDKHLRGSKFLDVDQYPNAKFISTNYTPGTDGKGIIKGNFTLHGITREIAITIQSIGSGKDPWGGYRMGFEGKASFSMDQFGLIENIGPMSKNVELTLSIEGIRVNNS